MRHALRVYSTGQYIATKQRFDQVNWGPSMGKVVKLLKKQGHKTWNLILTQVTCAAVTKPIGFHSLPFSFLANTVSRNRTFVHHMGLPLADWP